MLSGSYSAYNILDPNFSDSPNTSRVSDDVKQSQAANDDADHNAVSLADIINQTKLGHDLEIAYQAHAPSVWPRFVAKSNVTNKNSDCIEINKQQTDKTKDARESEEELNHHTVLNTLITQRTEMATPQAEQSKPIETHFYPSATKVAASSALFALSLYAVNYNEVDKHHYKAIKTVLKKIASDALITESDKKIVIKHYAYHRSREIGMRVGSSITMLSGAALMTTALIAAILVAAGPITLAIAGGIGLAALIGSLFFTTGVKHFLAIDQKPSFFLGKLTAPKALADVRNLTTPSLPTP